MGRNGENAAPHGSVLQVAWSRYLKQLDKKPLQTKVRICFSPLVPVRAATPTQPAEVPAEPCRRSQRPAWLAPATSWRRRSLVTRRSTGDGPLQRPCAQMASEPSHLLQTQRHDHSVGHESFLTGHVGPQLFGLVWSGPSNHYWQQFLERTFKGRKDAATVVEKVIVDQLVYGPLCNVLLLSYISLLIEGALRRRL